MKQGRNRSVSGLSFHFKQRLKERRIKISDVKESLKNPRVSFQNGSALIYVGPRVTVVIGQDGNLITAYKNREREYKGSQKKDVRKGRRQINDRQNKRIPRTGFGFDGEEG